MTRRITLLCICLMLASATCLFRKKGVDSLFPSPGFEKGWKWEGKPKHYTPQNLYEIINGEAELYISHGFKELASVLYYWGSAEDTFFVVDIYDMGSALNAFGLYSGFRHPDYRFENIGTEGFVSDYGIKFYKGDCFVDIKVGEFSERCRRAAWSAAGTIAGRIHETDRAPEMLDLLPAENQVPRTLRYIQKEMLNQGFLPGGIEARFAIEGGEATGFVVVFDSASAAARGFGELKTYYIIAGGGLLNTPLPGQSSFATRTPYHGTALVFLQGKRIAGVKDLKNSKQGGRLVRAIYEKLTLHGEKP
jgi:hypothetical protein